MNKINQLNGKKLRNVLASSVVLGTLALTGCSERTCYRGRVYLRRF